MRDVDLDLKLLAIFEEIYKEKSVSAAAANLRIAQPTVSMGLSKLRKQFNDPLFTRTSTGMEPTPRAVELWAPLTESLGRIRNALQMQPTFDPATSERSFRICMTDISQTVLLPALLHRLRRAPLARIEALPIDSSTPRLLEAAEADIAIGFTPTLVHGFFAQTLFTATFVCLVRQDHPRIRQSLSRKDYTSEAHVQVTPPGTGHWMIDKALEDQHISRRIALTLPNFLGLEAIVANSDLIATVPNQLADLMASSGNIRVFKSPVPLPSYLVRQHWHERFNEDPRSKWLRGTIAELFLNTRSKLRGGERSTPKRKPFGQ